MKKNILIATAVAAFSLTALNASAQSLSSVKSQIEKINLKYYKFYDTKDLSIVKLYTEDGTLFPPNAAEVHGTTGLTKDFSTAFADITVKDVKFFTVGVYGAPSSEVTEIGLWKALNPKGEVVDSGRYFKIWHKTRAGWKIFRDIFNSERKTN